MNVTMEASWKEALKVEFDQPYFKSLATFVKEAYATKKDAIFPKGNQIFRALNECPLTEVKVVILGQDPYPTKGHAHGLCFSVEPTVRPFPKSLNNIFKELASDVGKPFPETGDLSHWAKQGVLLLNATLTVEEGKPESHAKKGWEQFTDRIIEEINQRSEGVVYLLWGNKAQEKAIRVDASKNLILRAVHPSPLSAHRGFFGCKHFSQTNEYLKSKHKEPILW